MVDLESEPTDAGAATEIAQHLIADTKALNSRGYGEITVNSNTTPMTMASANTYYRWETGWTFDDEPLNMSYDLVHGTITVNRACNLLTVCLVNFSLNAADGIRIALFKNGAIVPSHIITEDVVTVNSARAVTIVGIDNAVAGDVYDVRIEDTTQGGTEVTFYNANFSMVAIN